MVMEALLSFLEKRRGLPTVIGVLLIVLNFIVQFVPGLGFLTASNLLLHLGLVLGLGGALLAECL